MDADSLQAGALTAEERLEMVEDNNNIVIDIQVVGDRENYPMIGDIVRVRYVCTLPNGKMLISTKHGLQRGSVEFVLGANQVIKGIERALPQMSVGERSKITVSSEYAYGKDGLYPHVAPHTPLIFDLTLLGFRQRPTWVKEIIQAPGTSDKPFMETRVDSVVAVASNL